MFGGTVKTTALLARPPTLTTTLPVVAALGTGTAILVVVQLVGVPAAPLKATVLEPCGDPNPVPETVTEVPTPPEVGLKLVIVGGVPAAGGLIVTAIALYEVVEVKPAVCAVPAAPVVILNSVSPPLPSIAPKV